MIIRYDQDELRDMAIRIVDSLVEVGIVKDCTDTDDMTEFNAQDIISEILRKSLNGKVTNG